MTLYDETFFVNSNINANINSTTDASTLKNSYRIVFLGAPRVGKTSIVNWFLGREYRDSYIPTIEDFHRKIYKIRGDIYRLDILDTSGNDPFPAMKKLNIMIGDLFVLVFSIDDIDSYVQVKSLCEQVIELKKQHKTSSININNTTISSTTSTSHHRTKQNIPILIIGNKLDLLLENKIQTRSVDTQEIEKFTSTLKTCLYYEVSCKNLIGLDRAFERLFFQTNLPIEMIPSKHRKVSLNLDLTKPQFPKQQKRQVKKDDSKEDGTTSIVSDATVNKTIGGLMRRSLKLKKTNETEISNSTTSLTNIDSGQTTVITTTILTQPQNINANNNESFKKIARRSFRKMTFRRQFTDACGAVWLNARRPSIRAEMNLLQVKSNCNFHLPNKSNNINSSTNNNKNKTIVNFFRKFFICTRRNHENDSYNNKRK